MQNQAKKRQKKGIWEYENFFPFLPKKYHLTLGEGRTTLFGTGEIFLKFEFENPTGSVKDRGFAYQISRLLSLGIRKVVLSSSGNAAISAAYYCHLAGLDLTLFLSPQINRNKLQILRQLSVSIFFTRTPVRDSLLYSRKNQAFNLRQSTDPFGLVGYKTIAYECAEEGDFEAIFIPTSSATTLVGIASGFRDLGKKPAFHAVQTSAVCPIASFFDRDFQPNKESLAEAIVAKYTPREEEAKKIIKESKGWGWVISNKEIIESQNWLQTRKIFCSPEGALALAAFFKAKRKGYRYKKAVCLLTGKSYA